MTSFDFVLAIVEDIDPDAAEYLRLLDCDEDEWKRVSMSIGNATLRDLIERQLTIGKSSVISGSFRWSDTPQGQVYWSNVNRKFKDRYETWFR